MKKLFILILVVLIAILGFVVHRSKPEGHQTVTNINTKTYANQTFGISFEYPEYYFLSERESGVSGIHYVITLVEDNQTNRDILSGKIKDTGGPPAITVDIYKNTAKENVIDWVKTARESNYNLSGATYSSTTVAGQSAVQYEWDGLYQGKSDVFSNNKNIIMVSATFIEHADRTEKDFIPVLESLKLSSK